MNFPTWLWFLLAVLVILAILWLLGVRLNAEAASALIAPVGIKLGKWLDQDE